jgi:IS30 family transposase
MMRGSIMRRAWRSEETPVLQALHAQGLPLEEIARRMKRPLGSIQTRLHRDHVKRKATPRLWTDDEVERVLDMRDANTPYKEIEKATGRARTAIQKKLKSLDPELLRRHRAKRHAQVPLPVAQSEDGWMKPLTRAQLMGGHA